MDKKIITEFYKSNLPHLPSEAKFRQFRLLLDNKTMIKIQKKIRTPEELQKYLIKYAPIAVYFTIAMFQNPELVGSRGVRYRNSKYLANGYLFSNFIMDFDSHNGESLYEPHKNMINAHKILKEDFGFKVFKFVRTGNGFHLHVLDYKCPEHPHPFNRELMDSHQRKKIVEYLRNKGIVFDEPISLDTRRIVRVFNTLHKNGTIIFETSNIYNPKLLNPPMVNV